MQNLICLRKRTSALPPSAPKLYRLGIDNASGPPTDVLNGTVAEDTVHSPRDRSLPVSAKQPNPLDPATSPAPILNDVAAVGAGVALLDLQSLLANDANQEIDQRAFVVVQCVLQIGFLRFACTLPAGIGSDIKRCQSRYGGPPACKTGHRQNKPASAIAEMTSAPTMAGRPQRSATPSGE